jgi:hypothetical protein
VSYGWFDSYIIIDCEVFMKRFLTLSACVLFTGVSVFAFDASYLLTYPTAVPEGSFALNGGVGYIHNYGYGIGTVPPLLVSLDYALPIGGLPFSIGGIFGFSGSRYTGSGLTLRADPLLVYRYLVFFQSCRTYSLSF